MLPYLARMIDPELWFAKEGIKFISMCIKSDNNTGKTISMVVLNGLYSILGANYRVLSNKYGMNSNNIMTVWKDVQMRKTLLKNVNKSGNCVRWEICVSLQF